MVVDEKTFQIIQDRQGREDHRSYRVTGRFSRAVSGDQIVNQAVPFKGRFITKVWIYERNQHAIAMVQARTNAHM